VRIRGKGGRRITIGARAASKLLVQVARVVLLVLGLATVARAQQADPEAGFPSTGPISGYMDFHVNKADGEAGVIDFHRFDGIAQASAERPLLHDGSAVTLVVDAIEHHGGEAELSRRGFERLTRDERERLLAFLRSL